jgi:hypothetical protein
MPAEGENTESTTCTGSSLCVLELRGQHLNDIDDLQKGLSMKESQLEKLTLDDLSELSCQKLTQYVPRLHRLHEVKLVFKGFVRSYQFDSQSWRCALRKKKSLRDVSISYENEPRVGLDYSKVQPLCERNCWAPGMLATAGSNEGNLETSPMPLSLIPSLCKVLVQSPRLAPTFLLSGMVVSNDTIGLIGQEEWARFPSTSTGLIV